MKKEEKEIFIPNIDKFVNHYEKNPESFITKIYGKMPPHPNLYKIIFLKITIGVFKFELSGNSDYILMIRNLTMCPSKYVLKTFDLKGSTYNREVDQEQRKIKPKMVLKDKEFFEEE